MRYAVLIAMLITMGAADLRADVLSLSLQKAIEIALERNEDIQVAREAVNNRESRVREVRSDALPSLTGRANYTRNIRLPVIFFETEEGLQQITIGEDNAYDFNLTLEQVIDVFGRVPKALKSAHLYSDIGKEDLQRIENEVVFDVRSSYYGVILAEQLRDVASKSLEQAEASLKQVESMVREGTRSRFDLLRARVEVANRKPELIRAENEVELADSRLKRVLGLQFDTEIDLSDELTMVPIEMDVDEGIALALTRRPELRSIDKEVEMGEIQVRLSGLERFPSLFLQSRYSIQGQTDKTFPESEEFARSWNASVGLTLPIFDGLKTSGRINQSRAQLSMARYQKQKAEEEVRLEVFEAFRNLETAKEEILSQQANVNEAEEAYRLATIRFANGLATQLEVNDVELALNLARTNFIQSLYDYNVARARVEQAIGEKVQ
jgi:outer membrane protein TolC